MNFMDIYYSVGNSLLENNYHNQNNEKKLELIDKELKDYAISKILEIDSSKKTLITENTTLKELVIILTDIIPKDNHFATIRHFIHYILNIASELQGFSIIWWVEKETELIDNPTAEFNIEGKWEMIATHEQTSYLKAFEFTYDVFRNKFMNKNYRQPTKLLIQ